MILCKLSPPEDRFSKVLRRWPNVTVVILGGGPSLTSEQVQLVSSAHRLSRVKCIVVNDAYLLAPWADVHYAADSHWHAWHTAGIPKPTLNLSAEQVRLAWRNFAGQKCSIENSGKNVQDKSVHMLHNKHGVGTHGRGISLDPQSLVTGRSSGFQAINLALLAGAQLALLLGFDAREGDSVTHWHGGHPRGMPVVVHEQWRRHFTDSQRDIAAAGLRVVNCSPGTAITAFERMPLVDALRLATREIA